MYFIKAWHLSFAPRQSFGSVRHLIMQSVSYLCSNLIFLKLSQSDRAYPRPKISLLLKFQRDICWVELLLLLLLNCHSSSKVMIFVELNCYWYWIVIQVPTWYLLSSIVIVIVVIELSFKFQGDDICWVECRFCRYSASVGAVWRLSATRNSSGTSDAILLHFPSQNVFLYCIVGSILCNR